jgi:ketosteroid isomerase-like protein
MHNCICISAKFDYLKLEISVPPRCGVFQRFRHGVVNDAHQGRTLTKKSSLGRMRVMTEHSLWRFSRALHRAINDRQHEDLEALIDDDIDWAVYGPIDMFPFFGARHGKAAVLEVIRRVADNIRVHRFDRESIMLGPDSAASMMRYSLTMLDANKPISLRLAQFAQFKAGKLASIRVLVDTFDLVEQALGHPIHLPRIAS